MASFLSESFFFFESVTYPCPKKNNVLGASHDGGVTSSSSLSAARVLQKFLKVSSTMILQSEFSSKNII